MRTLADTALKRARRDLPAGPMEATITAAPASSTAFLRVTVDAQPGLVREVPWPPRPPLVPLPGDAALVVESDAGELWCIAWWPNP